MVSLCIISCLFGYAFPGLTIECTGNNNYRDNDDPDLVC